MSPNGMTKSEINEPVCAIEARNTDQHHLVMAKCPEEKKGNKTYTTICNVGVTDIDVDKS